jgi:hypothetical protein
MNLSTASRGPILDGVMALQVARLTDELLAGQTAVGPGVPALRPHAERRNDLFDEETMVE